MTEADLSRLPGYLLICAHCHLPLLPTQAMLDTRERRCSACRVKALQALVDALEDANEVPSRDLDACIFLEIYHKGGGYIGRAGTMLPEGCISLYWGHDDEAPFYTSRADAAVTLIPEAPAVMAPLSDNVAMSICNAALRERIQMVLAP